MTTASYELHPIGWVESPLITLDQAPRQGDEGAPQFEYNRHMRAYYQTHPNATRAEAIGAWKELKAQRRTVDDTR